MSGRSNERKIDKTTEMQSEKRVKNEQTEERELTNPELSQVVGGIKILKPKLY